MNQTTTKATEERAAIQLAIEALEGLARGFSTCPLRPLYTAHTAEEMDAWWMKRNVEVESRVRESAKFALSSLRAAVCGTRPEDVVEAIAKQWDGCMTDIACIGEVDIGAAIRSDGVPSHLAAPQNAEDFRTRPASSDAAPSDGGSASTAGVTLPPEPTEEMMVVGLRAACLYDTPESRRDLRRAWMEMSRVAAGVPPSDGGHSNG